VPLWEEIVVIVAAYALGCFSTGYYLVRLWTGQDLRQLGSGTVGGRNAGRILGPAGFAITTFGDAAKGLIAVGAALYLGLRPWAAVLVLIAVVVGHIWPAQLGFHGGKGVATAVGALLGYNYLVVVLMLGLFLFLFALLRGFTLAGMLAFALAPFALLALSQPLPTVIGMFALSGLILFANRENIRARLPGRAPASEVS
jgi:glycerol-3-phosphate acyltransferase PlsY